MSFRKFIRAVQAPEVREYNAADQPTPIFGRSAAGSAASGSMRFAAISAAAAREVGRLPSPDPSLADLLILIPAGACPVPSGSPTHSETQTSPYRAPHARRDKP